MRSSTLDLTSSTRRWATIAALAAVLGLVAACSTTPSLTPVTVAAPGATPTPPATNAPPLPASLTLAPVATKNVAPGDPVTAAFTNGTLDTVTLTGPNHAAIAGAYDPARQSWRATPVLAYNAAYTLVASGTGADGQHLSQSRTFTTATAKRFASAQLWSYDWSPLISGGSYGVGQIVVVHFDQTVKDRASAVRALSITSDPRVEGAWRWMDGQTVHYRPKEYWPAGTAITVTAAVQGRSLGNGVFGRSNQSVSFHIGQSKIAIADSNTHHMKVYIDGVQVTTIAGQDVTAGIPVSMGKNGGENSSNGWIDFRTATGPHVVLRKDPVVRMTSASYGITNPKSPNFYDEKIRKAVRISGSGEFVHLADWNIPAHGKENTSHGCINVAPTYIYWFYDTFNPGDVVDVINTGRPLELRDGLGDWTLSWADWTA